MKVSFPRLLVRSLSVASSFCGSLRIRPSSRKRRTRRPGRNRRPRKTPKRPPSQGMAIPYSPGELVDAVGWYFLAPFLFASFIAIWFGIERLVVLRRGPGDSPRLRGPVPAASRTGQARSGQRPRTLRGKQQPRRVGVRPRRPQVGQTQRGSRAGDHRRRRTAGQPIAKTPPHLKRRLHRHAVGGACWAR